MGRAGRLLAQRPRSEREVRDRLERAGLEHDAIDGAVARLKELDLLDDSTFARQWVAERSKKRGRAALVMELTSKGIERDVVEAALGEVAADEEARAAEVAATALRKVAGLPPAAQAARLQQMLLRRGFSLDVAVDAVKAVLPPEGWD